MTVQQIAGRVTPPSTAAPAPSAPRGSDFAALLERAGSSGTVSLSAHAAERIETRGIDFSDARQVRLTEALDTLAGKGSRDAVLLAPDAAFVVNVPNRTVVTALAPDEMRDRAVTQIDSALIL